MPGQPRQPDPLSQLLAAAREFVRAMEAEGWPVRSIRIKVLDRGRLELKIKTEVAPGPPPRS